MSSNHERYEPSRRRFLKVMGGAAGALASAPVAYAHHHAKPSPQSLPYLDQRMYLHNMDVIAHFRPGELRNSGMQMMSIGSQRLLLQGTFGSSDVIDVTDPRHPQMFNQGAIDGSGQLAYNAELEKWVLITSGQVPYFASETPGGKYDDPTVIERFRSWKGLRGIRLYDMTNPAKIDLLSEFSTGQTGAGNHGDGHYYDGGRYAYLDVAPDDSFTGMLAGLVPLSNCLMIVDVSDPANVKEVSRWWLPGQRNDEIDALKKWPQVVGRGEENLPSKPMTMEEATQAFRQLKYPAFDRFPYTMSHGPAWVPTRVEDGGTVGYGSWSALGFMAFDLSDITKPRLIGRFDPAPTYGLDGIPFHTIWCGTVNRGFVVSISEALNPDCNESWLPNWVIDVRDPRYPVPISRLGRPKAPPDAPFTDFCFSRGRFSPHNPPPLQAPGKVSQTFLPVSYFNAGVRCYDLSEPTQPREVAYFVAPHGGDISDSNTFNRPTDNVFVEWDRKIVYAATTTGLYVLTSPALGEPIFDPTPITEWSLPSVNKGAPV